MKCVNSRKRLARFVQTYINFLSNFQIACLHYIKKNLPDPIKISLDDDCITVRTYWERGSLYIMEYPSIQYSFTDQRGKVIAAGGVTETTMKDVLIIINSLKGLINS